MMDSSTKKKNDLLGIPFGTASARLRKMLIFRMAQKLGEDICYRCGKKIENIEELSIEHKTSWQLSETPIDTFYDLDNVCFSHLDCNVNASYHATGVKDSTPHGETRYAYGCKCDACREAKKIRNKKTRTKHATLGQK
jgi:hypothetical protein